MPEIKVGEAYLLGTYSAGYDASDRLVVVTAIKPDDRGWYDDHQGGGWLTKGSVEYVYVDPDVHAERVGGCDSPAWAGTDYATDHWEAVPLTPCLNGVE